MGLGMINDRHEACPGLKHFKLLKTGVDVFPLLKAIESKPKLWDEITGRQDHPESPHRYTRSIFIKWPKDLSVHAVFNNLKSEWFPASAELPVDDLILEVLNAAKAEELARVLIVSLAPGASIDLHADEGAYADKFERFHLCLQSKEGNQFTSLVGKDAGEFVHMKQGEIWFFNHRAPHTLHNFSDEERIHLIVDAISPKYRMERA